MLSCVVNQKGVLVSEAFGVAGKFSVDPGVALALSLYIFAVSFCSKLKLGKIFEESFGIWFPRNIPINSCGRQTGLMLDFQKYLKFFEKSESSISTQ